MNKSNRRDPLGFFDEKTARFSAIGSAVFSIIVGIGIVYYCFSYKGPAYFDDKAFTDLKAEAYKNAGNTGLNEAVRAEDVKRRETFLESRMKVKFAAKLLFAGLLVFALSLRRLNTLRWKPPMPVVLSAMRAVPGERRGRMTSIGFVSGPVIVAAAIAFLIGLRKAEVPTQAGEGGELIVEGAVPEPVPDELKWPGFRGPTRMGIVPDRGFPKTWDASTGLNIAWKTEVPSEGKSSPIVWGRKVFLTGQGARTREVMCFNDEDGSILWSRAVRTQALLPPDFSPYSETGLAACSPITDGTAVYAFFGTNELVAFDFSGEQLWSRWFGVPDSMYGLATSPVLYEKILILQLDQGSGGEGNSKIYGINTTNGDIVWQTSRNVPGSWSSPIVVDTGDRWEVIACANPWVISYNPANGQELWRAKVLYGDVAPVPVYSKGLAYTVTEYAQLSAIKVGGYGDVTNTNVVWKFTEGLPDVASPLTDGNYLLMVATYGPITCLEADTGKKLWEEFPGGAFWSSPTLVGRNVYLTDHKGTTIIFELGGTFAVLSKGMVGEEVFTTPAFAGSSIYIRGKRNLFRIEEKK